jgi:16S rRNA (cytosine967-C5)-methyltransferase
LQAVRRGDLADRALPRVASRLESRDVGWVQELAYGTLRLRGRLDFLLGSFVRGPLEKLEPDVLDVPRLGAYQLIEMGSVPEYAAVSQSVELIRAAGSARASGFVNGVLQSVRRGWREVAFPDREADPVGCLKSWGSHPGWLVDRWVRRWGLEETTELIEANNRRPELFLRPVGMAPAEAIDRLAIAGIEAGLVDRFEDSVKLGSSASVGAALASVPAVVQDPAAAMVTRYAEVPDGATAIDLSSAPGGKTVGLAERAGFVVASDLSARRLRRVDANVDRVGMADRVCLVVADALNAPFREVDFVLLDAPCAGTGTLRRHPDGKWRISEADIAALGVLQGELLDAAAPLVKSGGMLVYSTCSLEPEENELQIDRFLSRHPNFCLAGPTADIDSSMLKNGYLSVLPQRSGVDGAFAARMVRNT